MGRYVSVWFRHLKTDWFSLRNPSLLSQPFVLRTASHGRMVITSANAQALRQGISKGMVLADARAILPEMVVKDDIPDLAENLLKRIGEWCIRFTPVVGSDTPDGLILDATGCTHLWGGEHKYISDIETRLAQRGYDVSCAIADTPGVAWAVARYGTKSRVISPGQGKTALLSFPPEALRIDQEISDKLHRLGLRSIGQFIDMPLPSLRKRFGQGLLTRIDRVLGSDHDPVHPIIPPEPYIERLPCMEPVVNRDGITIALNDLLLRLCERLRKEQLGLRQVIFKGYRVDGKLTEASVNTSSATFHVPHIFKLFDPKISAMEPGMGIELFTLSATRVEACSSRQAVIWQGSGNLDDIRLTELIDRIGGRVGFDCIRRYLPSEHHWPERSYITATSINEPPSSHWPADKIRPLQILPSPEPIEVTAPIPDYPPMLFRRKNKVHKIIKADGPERIEQEWWIQNGQHRDYYRVEDEDGHRYWLFRLGHYHDRVFKWFLHGFFS